MKGTFKMSSIALSVMVIFVVLLLILTLPPFMLDILLVINISLSLVILLITLFATEPLQFSVFPSLLLIVTLFRLALNISSTRLILGNQGDAGAVIATFGGFVIGGNLVVGLIIFLIIIVIQFVVITNGAQRVAEVAARFTLDAMPGKQMAIDADLNSGLIDEQTAKERRLKIQREADFYGAMDGASKFVKGDAIVGIIITVINVVGGLIIGVAMDGMEIMQAVEVFTLATVGDGLVSQIPALLVSTATGIIVTRAASDGSMGEDVFREFLAQPVVLIVAGAMLVLINFVPGLPHGTILLLAAGLIALGFMLISARQKKQEVPREEVIEQMAEETRKPENVVSLLQIDPIELEFGYGIIPLADVNQGGDLLDRVVMIRRQCALDLGMIVPVIRLRDNIQLASNEYVIKIKGNEIARGEVMADHYLAMNPGDVQEELQGIETVEPAFGLPATWISGRQRERAEMLGYTIVDPPSVIAAHLTEVLRRHGHELLGRQQVQALVENLRQSQPALVEEMIPKVISLGELQKVLANLLREGVSIRDLGTILETIGDYASITRDADMLTEYSRQALKRTITKRYAPDGKARVLTVDPALEQMILDNVRQTDHGSYVAFDNNTLQRIYGSLKKSVERLSELGISPLVLTSPVVRFHFKRLIEQMAPDLVVLSYNELEQNVNIESDGVVAIQ